MERSWRPVDSTSSEPALLIAHPPHDVGGQPEGPVNVSDHELTGLLHEQVTSELACPAGWAGRMSLCPGRTPESSVTMLSGSPVTARTG